MHADGESHLVMNKIPRVEELAYTANYRPIPIIDTPVRVVLLR